MDTDGANAEWRRLPGEHGDAASLASAVGKSRSPFSREYRRLLGAPSVRDVSQAPRRLTSGAVPVGQAG